MAKIADMGLLAEVQATLQSIAEGGLKSALEKTERTTRLQRLLASADEGALLRDGTALEEGLTQLTNHAGWSRRAASLSKLVAARLFDLQARAFRDEQEQNVVSVAASLSEWPDDVDFSLLDTLQVPPGYELSDVGLWRVQSLGGDPIRQKISDKPILITGAFVDLHEHHTILKVVWQNAFGDWVTRHVDRGVLVDSRRLVKLGSAGAPVDSSNSTDIVQWLVAFETRNGKILPRRFACSRLGWVTAGGQLDFMLPEGAICGSDIDVIVPEGFNAIKEQWGTKGSLDSWFEIVALVRNKPVAMLALYQALSSPLLHLLGEKGFVLDFSGMTSIGKTTIQRFAMSACGKPDEHDGCIYPWSANQVWVERTLGYLHDLTLALDDTKMAQEPRNKSIPAMVFLIASGQGKGRGSPDGRRATPTWRANALSSGESSITKFGRGGGAAARAIAVKEPPFRATTGGTADLVAELNRRVQDDYGHMLRELLWALTSSEEWRQATQDRFDAALAHLRQLKSVRSGAEARAMRYVALLDTTGWLIHALGVPRPDAGFDPIAVAVRAVTTVTGDVDIAAQALADVNSWVGSKAAQFWGRHDRQYDGTHRSPGGGWLGKWEEDEADKPWRHISIARHHLSNQLVAMGYTQPDEVLDRWKERGWLDSKLIKGKHSDRRDWIWRDSLNRNPTPCYRILREAIEDLRAYYPEEPESL